MDAFCNLDCGDGVCHIHEVRGKRDKKCLCPIGLGGETCHIEPNIAIQIKVDIEPPIYMMWMPFVI